MISEYRHLYLGQFLIKNDKIGEIIDLVLINGQLYLKVLFEQIVSIKLTQELIEQGYNKKYQIKSKGGNFILDHSRREFNLEEL